MGCSYVKDFDFGSKNKDGAVRYAKGGLVHQNESEARAARRTPKIEAMDKREMAATPTSRREAVMSSRKVQAPARRGVPVASREPLIAMKDGGCACGGAMKKGGKVTPSKVTSKKGVAKVGKVMGEFKSGELHSGSKGGPKVTNPKQAIAIALSEGRKAQSKR